MLHTLLVQLGRFLFLVQDTVFLLREGQLLHLPVHLLFREQMHVLPCLHLLLDFAVFEAPAHCALFIVDRTGHSQCFAPLCFLAQRLPQA
jgi:hypothetical protein